MENTKNILITLLQPTIVLLVGIFTIKFNNKFNKKDISFERLEKVYHPLFTEIEPILFERNIDTNKLLNFIDLFNKIHKTHSMYIDFSLKSDVKILNELIDKNDSQEEINCYWVYISSNIDKTYDNLSKICNIPIRKLEYRINNRHYDQKYKLFLYLFIFSAKNLLRAAILFLLILVVFAPINYLLLQVLK